MPGEPMKWPTKVWAGRSNSSSGVPGLDHGAVMHDHDLVGEGERLGLVVGHVDHGEVERAVQLLQGRAELPFQVRVDHRQRLVEQDGRHVGAHEAAPERDLLLHVGRQIARLAVEHAGEIEKARDLLHPLRRRLSRGTRRFLSGKARFSRTVIVS